MCVYIYFIFIMQGKFFYHNKFLAGICCLGAFFCFAGGISIFKMTKTVKLLVSVTQLRIDSLISIDLIFLAAALVSESLYFCLDPHKLFLTMK
jgi:hypothetical protein